MKTNSPRSEANGTQSPGKGWNRWSVWNGSPVFIEGRVAATMRLVPPDPPVLRAQGVVCNARGGAHGNRTSSPRFALMSTQQESPEAREIRRDRALVRSALDGDDAAMDGLADRLRCVPRILRTLNRRMGHPLTAEDLADLGQDTLVVIWRKLGTFEGTGRVEAWAYRFCFLLFMNRIRRKKYFVDPPEGGLDGFAARRETHAARDYEALEMGLEELGPPESEIIRSKHYDSRTFDEIAILHGISTSTVKSRYYRGLEWLRRRLEPVIRKETR